MNYVSLILKCRPLLKWLINKISKGLDYLEELEYKHKDNDHDLIFFRFCSKLNSAFVRKDNTEIKELLISLNKFFNKHKIKAG